MTKQRRIARAAWSLGWGLLFVLLMTLLSEWREHASNVDLTSTPLVFSAKTDIVAAPQQ